MRRSSRILGYLSILQFAVAWFPDSNCVFVNRDLSGCQKVNFCVQIPVPCKKFSKKIVNFGIPAHPGGPGGAEVWPIDNGQDTRLKRHLAHFSGNELWTTRLALALITITWPSPDQLHLSLIRYNNCVSSSFHSAAQLLLHRNNFNLEFQLHAVSLQ